MPDPPDYDLRPADQLTSAPAPAAPRSSSPAVWIVIAAAVVLLGMAAYYYLSTRTPATAPTSAAAPAVQPPPDAALGRGGLNITLPPLDMSDALIRQLVGKLSSHPRVAAWLATDGLVRNFTVVVVNTAQGRSPAPQLRTLRPAGTFLVMQRGNETLIDPRSYDRYNSLADAATSIDPAGAAQLYMALKPLIDQAYAELGFPDIPFDRMLERAIVRLLETPVLEEPVRVKADGIGWAYADPRLEGLTSAQRQLLRFGPRNERIVQASLRNIAQALGVPAQRLPLQ